MVYVILGSTLSANYLKTNFGASEPKDFINESNDALKQFGFKYLAKNILLWFTKYNGSIYDKKSKIFKNWSGLKDLPYTFMLKISCEGQNQNSFPWPRSNNPYQTKWFLCPVYPQAYPLYLR